MTINDNFPDFLLTLDEVAITRGGRVLVEDFSLDLRGGQCVLVKGPNGCGKTSLLRTIAGLCRPNAGDIVGNFAGERADFPNYRHLVHAVFANNGVHPLLTAGEYWEFTDQTLGEGVGCKQQFALLDEVRFRHRQVQTLSTGQKRRVALSRLTLVPRPIWILDEPESGLDQTTQVTLASVIADHATKGGAVIIATHGNFEFENCFVVDLSGVDM